ncbi:hypothetical protein [Phormidium nigroviride]
MHQLGQNVEEGRRKKEEGRRKKEEGRGNTYTVRFLVFSRGLSLSGVTHLDQRNRVFYQICGLERSIFVKNPVSGPSCFLYNYF